MLISTYIVQVLIPMKCQLQQNKVTKERIDCMKKVFTVLSVFCFLLTLFMLFSLSQDWKIGFIDYLFGISIFTPIIINILGVILSIFSTKGATRIILVMINSLMLICFGVLAFVAMFGFQEP